MAPVNNSLASKQTSFAAFISKEAVKNNIQSIVGGKEGTKFIAAVMSAVNNNEDLQECTNASIVSAALLGHSLNLSPSPQLGQYYLVPYKDKEKGKVAQFQLGYKGYIQLAIRSGQYKKLNVIAIKEGELVRFDPLNEEIEVNLIEDDEVREQTPTIGYYAMFEYTNGFRKALYWSKKKMEAHALKYSAGYRKKSGYTFWEKDFDSMAYKTMLRQIISKWGIMSIEMQNAISGDMAVINEDGTKDYVDNVPDIIETRVPERISEQEKKAEVTQPADDVSAALFD